MLNCTRKPISHESQSDECDIGFKVQTAVWFYSEIDEIDDVDTKQYHRASFSTRNSALNTSLRKPIRMQDFIQLCDSKMKPITLCESISFS